MKFDSYTTESIKFPNSISHADYEACFASQINVEEEQQTYDPTTTLDKHYNKHLYVLFNRSTPGTFKQAACEMLSKDPLVLETMKRAGLILEYYVYSMQYLFSAKKWKP